MPETLTDQIPQLKRVIEALVNNVDPATQDVADLTIMLLDKLSDALDDIKLLARSVDHIGDKFDEVVSRENGFIRVADIGRPEAI
jgi:hypothetical protein